MIIIIMTLWTPVQVKRLTDVPAEPVSQDTNHNNNSWKILWGIKFGGLLVYVITAKLKFAKISYSTYGDSALNRQI